MKTIAKKSVLKTMIILAAILYIPLSSAGVLNPDCTAEKAAKSAAAKATVGIGGREIKRAGRNKSKREQAFPEPTARQAGNDTTR